MEVSLQTVDYVVMGIFVSLSFGIGIFYGICKKQQTTETYLLGDRQMHLLPVALSLVVTYQSASSVLGIPAEIYMYHTMGQYLALGIILAVIVQGVFIAPFVHPLKLTSAYEYLGRRYQSRAVQLMGTSLGMLQTLLYMATVLYAPALALEAVAKIPLWLSVVLIGTVGTLYTSLGGIKSVVWTDVFQFVVLYGGLIGILAIGTQKVGGIHGVFHEAIAGHRVRFNIIDPDPTVRHSVWTCVIGGFFMWLPNCCNQSAVQRMSSVRTVKDSRISVFLNVPLILLFESTLMFVGLMLFAYFRLIQCDPIGAEYVDNANQILPYFVMMILQDVPGLAGIFVAALFSGSLSSLSSGINAMAANTIQDVMVGYISNKSQFIKTLIAKCFVLVYGVVAVTLAYFAKYLAGPITQIALTCMGATGSPVAGIMFLGAIFPQANYIGALSGGFVGISLNIWVAVGSFLYGNQAQRSPLNPTSGCLDMNSTYLVNMTSTEMSIFETTTTDLTNPLETTDDEHLGIYDISYMYFGLIGFVSSVTVGLVISLLTRTRTKPTTAEYIMPGLRSFWQMEYLTDQKSGNFKEEVIVNGIDQQLEQIKPVDKFNSV